MCCSRCKDDVLFALQDTGARISQKTTIRLGVPGSSHLDLLGGSNRDKRVIHRIAVLIRPASFEPRFPGQMTAPDLNQSKLMSEQIDCERADDSRWCRNEMPDEYKYGTDWIAHRLQCLTQGSQDGKHCRVGDIDSHRVGSPRGERRGGEQRRP